MNKFQESENKGRQLFKSFLDQIGATGQPTEDIYDRVDYYFQLNGKKAVAEIKVRYSYYNSWIIEVDKLKALLQKRKERNLDGAIYVCFYGNSMYIYQISVIKKYGIRDTRKCKDSTVAFSGYVLKDVLYVPNDKASRYDLVNGKWQKSNPTY